MFSDHKSELLLHVGKTFKFTRLQITKNLCELSAMISENVEITCLKWLKNRTCSPVKPSVTSENFIFSHLSFLCLLSSPESLSRKFGFASLQ